MGGNMPILHSGDSDTKTMKQNSRVLSSSMYLSTMLSINVGILASRLVLASSSLADDVSDDVVVGGVVGDVSGRVVAVGVGVAVVSGCCRRAVAALDAVVGGIVELCLLGEILL